MAIDILFIIDIFINLRTTYLNKQTGLEVVSGKAIALNYIKTG